MFKGFWVALILVFVFSLGHLASSAIHGFSQKVAGVLVVQK
jgi:hypothetical protein